jgi:hypothetical protein
MLPLRFAIEARASRERMHTHGSRPKIARRCQSAQLVCNRMYLYGIAATIGATTRLTAATTRAVQRPATRETRDHAVFSATRSMACALNRPPSPTSSLRPDARY